MKQPSLAEGGFEKDAKPRWRAEFPRQLDRVVLWQALCERIEPHDPKAGNGRVPMGLEVLLRIQVLQHG
jgi:transposase, IS5 family